MDNPIRNLINFYSEILLVVQGEGKQYFLSENYQETYPLKIILNGKEEIKNPSNLGEDRSNITLKFYKKIEDYEEMFSYLENIDLSNFDISGVKNIQ